MVQERIGKDIADSVDWSEPTVICIANEFGKTDETTVNRINPNIKLVRYRKYKDHLSFEYPNGEQDVLNKESHKGTDKTKK